MTQSLQCFRMTVKSCRAVPWHPCRAVPCVQVVSIYGYSAAFGAAPHEVAAALVRKWYPLYPADSITVSYEGY